MPTMVAAFVYSLLDEGLTIPADRALEIAIGFVMAFISALLVVGRSCNSCGASGFVPFAWYRIGLGLVLLAGDRRRGWL